MRENEWGLPKLEGTVSVTKVRNMVKKIGCELVNAGNVRVNGQLRGASGFVRHPDGRLVYFDTEDCATGMCRGKILYRTAKHDRDYTGGTNNFCSPSEFAGRVAEMFGRGRKENV